MFDFIREDAAKQILQGHIDKISNALKESKEINITFSDEVLRILQDKAFGNLENGGRGIGNMIEKYLINPLSRYLFDNGVSEGANVLVKGIVEEDKIISLICE